MSTNQTSSSSFWTKEEDKIFENTIALYFNDKNLFTKIAEALPWKSEDDILNHYNILLEDVAAIESGHVPLPDYPEVKNDSDQNPKTDAQGRRGAAWTELEHRSFIRGLEIYGRGDWKSISRNCVKTRTPTQVASHAQKYFKRLESSPKENRRASILDITSADDEAAETSQAVPSTNNESILPQESIKAEQIIAAAGEESAGHNADVKYECGIYDIIMEKEESRETGVAVDAGKSILPSEQPCTAASTGTSSHPITRFGSELEALITEHKDEDNDINSIFDDGKASTSRG